MSSSLAGIPVHKRRQIAGTLGLFAALFIAVGAVAVTGTSSALLTVIVVIAFVVGAVLAVLCWGVAASITDDVADRQLDAAVEAALAAAPPTVRRQFSCGCGQEHDPDEMHVVDAEPPAVTDVCAHDGAGVACTHSCDTCALARLRPSPTGQTAT